MNIHETPAITVHELKRRLDSGERVEIIDVREVAEHQVCNLKQAVLIPMRQLPAKLAELDKTVEYAVLCKVGGRSAQAVDFMRRNGLKAVNITGGIIAWAREIDKTMPTY